MQLLLFGFAVEAGPLAAIALGGLQNGAPLLLGVDCPLYACHGVFLSSSGRKGGYAVAFVTVAGQPLSNLLTRLVSLPDTVVRPSSRRVRVLDLCSSKCRRLAFSRTIFPVPVRRNRFDAPLWLLVLGICLQSSVCLYHFGDGSVSRSGAACGVGLLACWTARARVFAPRCGANTIVMSRPSCLAEVSTNP